MNKENTTKNPLEIIGKQIEKHPKIELGINVLKATLSTIPFGGGFASLINDYMPKIKTIRMEKFIKQLGDDLNKFKDEIDEKYIKTEEFMFIFEKTFKLVSENYQDEKMSGFRAILVNSLRNKNTEQEERELFINLFNELSIYHFRFLSVFKNPIEWNMKNGNKVKGATTIISTNRLLRECFNDIDEETIRTIISDLYNKGLIKITPDSLKTTQGGGGIEKLNNSLTTFGRKFIKFVSLEK